MPARVGRADLLRALHLGCEGPLTLEQTDTQWWGYVRTGDHAENTEIAQLSLDPLPFAPPDTVAPSVNVTRKPRSALRMPEAWVTERLDRQEAPDDGPEPRWTGLTREELHPADEPKGVYCDLVPLPRLARPLARHLRQSRAGGVDYAALLHASAQRRWPRRLPRSPRSVWPQHLVVVLDGDSKLFPYHYDMYGVVGLLRHRVPRAQLQVLIGRHGPFGAWEVLKEDLPQSHDTALAEPEEIPLHPQPGRTYLLLSDLGLLRDARTTQEPSRRWKTWLAQARQRDAVCVALAPVAAEDVDAELASLARIVRWSPDSRWLAERGRAKGAAAGHADGEPEALRELLACLAATWLMDPPLLRAMRQCGSAAHDASLEGRLWAHPEVQANTFASLRREFRNKRLADAGRYAGLLGAALHHHAAEHHRHWPASMRLVEGMQQLAAVRGAQPALQASTREGLYRLAHSLKAEGADRAMLNAAADYVLRHAPAEAWPYLGEALDALAQARGQAVGPRRRWTLWQRGEQLWVVPAADDRLPGPGALLDDELGWAASGEPVLVAQPQKALRYLSLPASGGLALQNLEHGAEIVLGGWRTRLLRRKRTRGVWAWGQHHAGFAETMDMPWPKDLHSVSDRTARALELLPDHSGGQVVVALSRDDYGMVLAIQHEVLVARGFAANAFIRFRYLEPATFLQGSPEGVGDDDEHPQHPVTLTQGLWLAETPCTQALWQAVMGRNPSRFSEGEDAPRRPVDSVSWDNVQAFLGKLQDLLPSGCEAVLPTESQWEYACRAGTQTEYWWGDVMYETKANVDMTGQKSLGDKQGTTPVDRYPPNPWGLFDMHGNVWEWCADGWRDYTAELARDPEGPMKTDDRLVRGGSWFALPVGARAAFRGGGHRGIAIDLGFRFALRSSGGPEARPGGPSEAGRGGAAGGRTAGAEAPAAKPPRPARPKRGGKR